MMGRGYQVEGVEPVLEAREQAIYRFGIRVLPDLDAIEQREHYQVITLWHVLEHLPNLHKAFKHFHSLLAPGGTLIIAVPDRESWDAQHYGTAWAAWDVPRHFSHFSRQDVRRLLREHGFSAIITRRMWLDAYYIALLSERYNGTSGLFIWPKALAKATWSNALALLRDRPTSSSFFIARKQ